MIKKTLVLLALSCMGLANNAVSQSLESSKDIYFQDEFLLTQPVIVNFSDGPGNPKDWIGIYDGERMPGDGLALVWSYVDGTDVGSVGKKSGTLQYDKVLKPGPYKAYFLENNGYDILATTSFIITDDESDLEPELPEGVYFEENFDGVNLGPFESDSESNGDGTDWASEGPAGWVMRKNNGHGLTGGGSDVVEFDGWTFLDPVSWDATAGQDRSNFTKGTGVIAVADSDEYDDKDDARLNATLSTPSIDISDASGSKLILKYDSSWRKEPQIGSVSVSYDGGVQIELLKLDGNSPDAYNETVELELNNPSGAKFAVISWNYEGHNNWWWAIDNISVYKKVVENTAPVVSGQSLSVNEDEAVSITLQGSDEDKDDLTFTVLSQPKNGVLSGTGANLTYTPKANYNGSDSFTFKANDGEKDSNTATVAISVKSVNDLPVVFSQSVIVDEDGSVSITLKAQDNDGDNLKYIVVSQPKNGTLSGATPNLTYSPKANFNGDDSFTFKVFDGLADSNTATVAISVKAMEKPKLILSKNEYLNDEKIRVDFRGGPGNKKDWIGIFRKGQKPGGIESVQWNYVDGTKSGANAKSSGLLEFNSLSEGSYEVFYLENDGYKILSSATFNVISIEKTVKLEYGKYSNTPVEFEIWDSVIIEYSGGQGNSKDWLGARLANQNGNFGNWINLSSEFKSGKVEFGGLKPGLYDLWWLTNNRQSASAKFKVLASNQGPINPDTSWTVFVYGNADHDLTSSWLEDLEEMKMAGGNENFNIVVFSDLNGNENGEETASLNKYGVKEEHRKKVTYGVIRENEHKIIKVLPELNSDDPDVLGDFLDWGLSNYPADRYGIVLWNHGGQWGGFGGDKENETRKFGRPNMKSPDIKDVALKILNNHGLSKFDFLSFDTCLMAGAEILADIHKICDVYIACAELDYGDGWDYMTTFSYLKAFPDITNFEFAKKETELWGRHHNRGQADKEYKTQIAYNMKYFDEYNLKLKAFTSALLNESKNITPNNALILGKLRREAIHYGNSGREIRQGSTGVTEYIDLGSFAEKISIHYNGALKTASLELVEAINNMIISKSMGTKRQNAVGLNIYYPIGGDVKWYYSADKYVYYNGNTVNEIRFRIHLNFLRDEYGGNNWLNYLNQVKKIALNDKAPPKISSSGDGSRSGRIDEGGNPPEEEDYYLATVNDPAIMEFEVTNGADAYSAYVSLVSNELTENPNQYIYLGEVGSALLDGDGVYEVYWDASMPIISLAESDTFDPIYLGGWALEPGSNLYISFADYQAPESDELIPLILYTRFSNDGYGTIETIMEDNLDEDSEIANKLAPAVSDIVLEPGGKLYPVYYMEELNDDGEFEPWFISSEDIFITMPENGKDGIEISSQRVEEGNYTVEVQTFDYFDNGSEVLTYFVQVPEMQDEDSMPKLSIGLENGKVVVSWPIEFIGYSLEWTNDLGGGKLITVPANEINISEEKHSYIHQPVEKSRFYRLIKR